MVVLPIEISEGSNNLTKEYILSNISQEQIMEHYLGVHVTKKMIKSPLRVDSHPTCSFTKKNGRLLFTDFSGDFKGDCFEVVKRIYNCGFYDSVKIIANDFGLIKDPSIEVNKPKIEYSGKLMIETSGSIINITTRPFDESDLEWWGKIGVSYSTLVKGKVFCADSVFINDKHYCSSSKANPIYAYYYGKKQGVQQWKIYFPKKRTNRFLMNTRCMQGTFLMPKTGELLVITKSYKDVLVFYEMGIPAIAPQSENFTIDENTYHRLTKRFKRIVVLYDNDRAGISAMLKIRKSIPISCFMCSLWDKKRKDLSDCVSVDGFENVKNKVMKIYEDVVNGNYDYKIKSINYEREDSQNQR